jgi:hypothetical protein
MGVGVRKGNEFSGKNCNFGVVTAAANLLNCFQQNGRGAHLWRGPRNWAVGARGLA